MPSMSRGCLAIALVATLACSSQPDVVAVRASSAVEPTPPELIPLSGNVELVDPSVLFDGQAYWIASTGPGMPLRSSTDLRDVTLLGDAVDGLPDWADDAVPAATHYWSPDLASFGGRYHLYYALASSTPRQACIGHATATELGTVGAWTDDGAPLLCTQPEADWFAIDPSVLVEADGSAWLLVGSSRAGLKLFELNEDGGLTTAAPTPVAARPDGGVIQASAITRRGDYYYLFSSFDQCCQGVDSTRSIRVGRSASRLGPYLDRQGLALLDGGGTTLLQSGERWRGPGSNDVLHRGDQSYHFFFAYDAERDGRSFARLSTLTWDEEGWPRSAGP
jgi:arabinan endo-1,5-alpha-L-arabinosidase